MTRRELIGAFARKVEPNALNERLHHDGANVERQKGDDFHCKWRRKIIVKTDGIASTIEAELHYPA